MRSFLLICLSIFPLVLFGQTTYYVSSSRGNDENSGLTQDKPWATIKELRTNSVFKLKRGDTFYFQIPRSWNSTPARPIVITDYGSGEKPIISGYKTVKRSSWQQVSETIFKAIINTGENYYGIKSKDTNVGFININGEIHGNRVKKISDLRQGWDFYCDSTSIYVFCKNKSDLLKHELRLACNRILLNLSSNMKINNIQLIGTGAHAIQGVGVEDVLISGVKISDIGGAFLGPKFAQRYGNGIEFYFSARNCLVRYCTITNVYDAGFTMQGNASNAIFENIFFKNNILRYNEQSLEIWITGGRSGFKNCIISENKCYSAGYGWSHKVREDKNAGVHLLNYSWEVSPEFSDLSINNNIFDGAIDGYIFMADKRTKDAPLFRAMGNKIYLKKTTPIRSLKSGSKYLDDDTKRLLKKLQIDVNSSFIKKSN